MTQHQRELLHTPALEAALPFQCRALNRSAVLSSKAGQLLGPEIISWHSPSLYQPVRASPGVSNAAPPNMM